MSGGHFDYFYLRLEDLAKDIAPQVTPEEKELANLLLDLSVVLHDLEWWKSQDINYEDFKRSWFKFKEAWLKKEIPELSLYPIREDEYLA